MSALAAVPDARREPPCCVLTGASSGIGRAAATELARRGVRLALVCRSPERAEETRDEILQALPAARVDVFLADLSRQAAIRRVAGELLEACPAIDVLLNNAGLVNLRRETTADGHEATFAVNHLAAYLLTRLLLERLRASAPARIVTVASHAHRFVRSVRFDDLGFERGYSWRKAYGQSKLANIHFTSELARRLSGSGVTANCLHPGAVATRLGSNNGRLVRALLPVLGPLFRTPERGADTAVWLATAPEVAGVSGGYFMDRREVRAGADTSDPDVSRRLWEVSARLTGLPV